MVWNKKDTVKKQYRHRKDAVSLGTDKDRECHRMPWKLRSRRTAEMTGYLAVTGGYWQ